MKSHDLEALLTLRETAEILRLSKTKLFHERKAGRLKSLRFGRSVRVLPEAIHDYLEVAELATKREEKKT